MQREPGAAEFDQPPFPAEAASAPSDGGAAAVESWRGFRLNRFQLRAVDAIHRGANVLVAAPTGAGKTLVAEYAMADAVQRGRRCIYTAPIKALSNQKYRDFRDDPQVHVGIMTGDVTIHPESQVLIMTTEILRNALFENPELLRNVEYVIFDEIHYLDDRERGSVWEESLIFLPPSIRLICLSATIANVDEIGGWLGEIRPQPIEIIRSNDRPVPLSHWLHTRRNGTFDVGRLGAVARRVAAERDAGRPSRNRHKKGRGRGLSPDELPPDPHTLFDELYERALLPALVFSFSRRDCARLARANSTRNLLTTEEAERMKALQHELIRLFQLDEAELSDEILALARRGVSYHHAGMLPIHKELVERMFTAGLLKLLFTTETFALGINMPARSVVFYSLRKFDGVNFDWLRTRDYMQMAGRAGRQGIDEKGYVFSLASQKELLEAPIQRLVAGQPEPVVSRFRLSYSTLLYLVERLGRERVHEAWGKSFHEYQGRAKNKKARDRHQREQRHAIEAHFRVLEQLGYLDGDRLTARGRVARMVSGYELAVTEMLFRGTLENLPPKALAVVFVGLIHEERRRFDRPYVPARLFGNLRDEVSRLVGELGSLEVSEGVQQPTKRPDWGLTEAVLSWYEGARFEELDMRSDTTPGDLCRALRMSIQLMRNVCRAIDADWDLSDRLRTAVLALNRDEVDARRQLELG